jgi:hypothetical protein
MKFKNFREFSIVIFEFFSYRMRMKQVVAQDLQVKVFGCTLGALMTDMSFHRSLKIILKYVYLRCQFLV